jgi:hypothetical protein
MVIKSLKELTVSQLRDLAKKKGVVLPSRALKADIISILEHTEPAAKKAAKKKAPSKKELQASPKVSKGASKTHVKVKTKAELVAEAKAMGMIGTSMVGEAYLRKYLAKIEEKPSSSDLKLPKIDDSDYRKMDKKSKLAVVPCLVVNVLPLDHKLVVFVIKKVSADLSETYYSSETVIEPSNGVDDTSHSKDTSKKVSPKKVGASPNGDFVSGDSKATTRKELLVQAKKAGITGFSKMTKDQLKAVLASASGRKKKPATAAPKKKPAKKGLESKTLTALRKMAKDAGIPYSGKLSKAQVIEALLDKSVKKGKLEFRWRMHPEVGRGKGTDPKKWKAVTAEKNKELERKFKTFQKDSSHIFRTSKDGYRVNFKALTLTKTLKSGEVKVYSIARVLK